MRQFRTPPQMLESNLIVSHYAGSIAYGTNLPTSDVDIRGIFCADENFIRNPWLNSGEISVPEEEDTKYYELTKFIKLCVEQNPNIIESLWIDPQHIIVSSPAYNILRSYRQELLSSKMLFTYSGYAHSQLTRIKGHHKWLNNPQPEKMPQQVDFCSLVQDFSTDKNFKADRDMFDRYQHTHILIPYGNNIFGMIKVNNGVLYNTNNGALQFTDKTNTVTQFPDRIIKFNLTTFTEAIDFHANYWTWRKNRNIVRSELEEKYQYDTKHAAHLIRLLTMAVECLSTGELHVYRKDAEELKKIRSGKYTYEEILQYATDLDSQAKQAYKTTPLRKQVDLNTSAKILFEVQDSVWSR